MMARGSTLPSGGYELQDHGSDVANASVSDAPENREQLGPGESQAIEQLGTVRRRGKGRSLELNFSEAPLSPDARVIVFHHIRKTAGTSLRYTFRASLAGRHEYAAAPEDSAGLAEWHKAYYDGLSAEDKQQLVYIGGHSAGYFIPVLERPVRAVTMVREPIDQVLSRYFFMREREWTLADLCADAELRAKTAVFNAQARSLLEPHYDLVDIPEAPDDPEAESWRARLDELISERYLIGVQDRFEDSLAMFRNEFEIEIPPIRRLRVNPDRPRDAQVDQEVLGQLARLSWLDRALYERAGTEMDRYFQDKPPEARNLARPAAARATAESVLDSAPETVAEVHRQLQAVSDYLREELDSVRDELKEVTLRMKTLERKQRQERNERRAVRAAAQEAQGRGVRGLLRRMRGSNPQPPRS